MRWLSQPSSQSSHPTAAGPHVHPGPGAALMAARQHTTSSSLGPAVFPGPGRVLGEPHPPSRKHWAPRSPAISLVGAAVVCKPSAHQYPLSLQMWRVCPQGERGANGAACFMDF